MGNHDVGRGGTHIFGRVVAAAQAVNKTAKGAEQLLTILCLGIGYDHRLTATHSQTGQRVLVSHTAGEAQHVSESFIV